MFGDPLQLGCGGRLSASRGAPPVPRAGATLPAPAGSSECLETGAGEDPQAAAGLPLRGLEGGVGPADPFSVGGVIHCHGACFQGDPAIRRPLQGGPGDLGSLAQGAPAEAGADADAPEIVALLLPQLD